MLKVASVTQLNNRRFATIACLFIVASQATAHSGGTDAHGCHAGSQPYHCHPPKTPSYEDYPESPLPRKRYRSDPQIPSRHDLIDPNSPAPKNKVTACLTSRCHKAEELN